MITFQVRRHTTCLTSFVICFNSVPDIWFSEDDLYFGCRSAETSEIYSNQVLSSIILKMAEYKKKHPVPEGVGDDVQSKVSLPGGTMLHYSLG